MRGSDQEWKRLQGAQDPHFLRTQVLPFLPLTLEMAAVPSESQIQ